MIAALHSRSLMLGLLLAAVSTLPAAGSSAPADELGSPVTVRQLGAPLAGLLAEIAPPGVELALAPELKDAKVTVIVRDVACRELMEQLASVFGGEWKLVRSAAPRRYELRLASATRSWLASWRRARGAAEQSARERQAEFMWGSVRTALEALSKGLPRDEQGQERSITGVPGPQIARVLAELPERELKRILAAAASGAPLRDGEDPEPVVPVVYARLGDLNATQQTAIRKHFEGYGATRSPVMVARADAIDQTLVIFDVMDGITIGVYFAQPGDPHWEYGPGLGYSRSSRGMELWVFESMLRQLADKKTPDNVLLGARVAPDGTIGPAVDVESLRPLRSLPEDERAPVEPRYIEFLPALARSTDLFVVSDHYTRSRRARLPDASTLGPLLDGASRQFEVVFRQRGRYLLCRSMYWPERDLEETPAPWPEHWLALKSRGRPLPLEDLLVMSELRREQLAGLGAYVDGQVHFRQEVALIRSQRWVPLLLERLPRQQREKAYSEHGLPIHSLPLILQHFAARASGLSRRVDWGRVHLHVKRAPAGEAQRFSSGRSVLRVPGEAVPVWASL